MILTSLDNNDRSQCFSFLFTLYFNDLGEISALAGCDLLTISPKLLEELQSSGEEIPRILSKESGKFLILEFSNVFLLDFTVVIVFLR